MWQRESKSQSLIQYLSILSHVAQQFLGRLHLFVVLQRIGDSSALIVVDAHDIGG